MRRLVCLIAIFCYVHTACDDTSGGGGDSVSFPVGPKGGKLELPDGSWLEVPPDALDEVVDITFGHATSSDPSFATLVPVGEVYELSPSGQQFSSPATLFLHYDTDAANGEDDRVRAFLSSDDGQTWEKLTYDSSSKPGLVGGKTSHFSLAVAGLPVEALGGGETAPDATDPTEGSETPTPTEGGGKEGGGTGSTDGCSAAAGPGCGGCPCEQKVCTIVPACCESVWSDNCAQLCEQLQGCGPPVGTEGGNGSGDAGNTEGGNNGATCAGQCQSLVMQPGDCYCDATCVQYEDCCDDACIQCGYCMEICGDGECSTSETCSSCAVDCGACCPNGKCDAALGETCESCANDCGICPWCGDGACNGEETCSTCKTDCGDCGATAVCGDGTCGGGETCSTCPSDCGDCGGTSSCVGHCGESTPVAPNNCYCDPSCLNLGDCCNDACSLCDICP